MLITHLNKLIFRKGISRGFEFIPVGGVASVTKPWCYQSLNEKDRPCTFERITQLCTKTLASPFNHDHT